MPDRESRFLVLRGRSLIMCQIYVIVAFLCAHIRVPYTPLHDAGAIRQPRATLRGVAWANLRFLVEAV